jgi:hypothetical protein
MNPLQYIWSVKYDFLTKWAETAALTMYFALVSHSIIFTLWQAGS